MNDPDYERQLTSALVTLAGRGDDYRNDAHFKHSVDILVRLLPYMVNGIGVQAEAEAESMHEEVIKMMMSTTWKALPKS